MDVRISFCIIESVPCGSAGKESTCNAGDLGSIPGLGGSPGEGKSYPLQYFGLYSPCGGKGSDMAERLSLSASLIMLKPLTVWITTTFRKFFKRWFEKPVCRSRSNSQNWTWNNRLVPNRKRSMSSCILSPCLFNLYAEYIMRNAGLEETQVGIKIAGRNINNLRCADDTSLMEKAKSN